MLDKDRYKVEGIGWKVNKKGARLTAQGKTSGSRLKAHGSGQMLGKGRYKVQGLGYRVEGNKERLTAHGSRQNGMGIRYKVKKKGFRRTAHGEGQMLKNGGY